MTLSFVTIVTFRAKILEVIKKLSIFAAEWTVMYTKKEWEANHITPFYHNVEQDAISL